MIIDSPANPTVKLLRSLESARGIAEQGLFLAEGVRLVEDGLKEGFWPAVCLYSPELLGRTERGRSLLRQLTATPAHDKTRPAPVEATPRALQAASATMHAQGVVAAFPLIDWPPPSRSQDAALGLICDNIQDPGNLGTILRSAEAAGVGAVWLSPGCVGLYNPKVVRAAMGAHFRLPVCAGGAWSKAAEWLSALGLDRTSLYATEASAPLTYDAVDWTRPAALLVSNEAHGLSGEARELAAQGHAVSVPMHGSTESLNASIAAAVILFEAARQRRVALGGKP